MLMPTNEKIVIKMLKWFYIRFLHYNHASSCKMANSRTNVYIKEAILYILNHWSVCGYRTCKKHPYWSCSPSLINTGSLRVSIIYNYCEYVVTIYENRHQQFESQMDSDRSKMIVPTNRLRNVTSFMRLVTFINI